MCVGGKCMRKVFSLYHFFCENDLKLKKWNENYLQNISYRQTLSANLFCHHSNAIYKHIIHKKGSLTSQRSVFEHNRECDLEISGFIDDVQTQTERDREYKTGGRLGIKQGQGWQKS